MAERIAAWLARAALTHTRLILWIAAIVAGVSLASASFLRFDPDILNLVPQENREINEFRRVLSELGTIDYHVVVVELPPDSDAGDYESLVDSLGERLRGSARIQNATWRLPDPLEYLDALLPNALLFLDPSELEQVAARMTDEAIREAVVRNKALLQTPQAAAMESFIRNDPFNFLPIYLQRFQRTGGGFRVDTESGYYLSEDRSTYLILTKPVRPAQDVPFGRELVKESRAIADQALADLHRDSPGIPLPAIELTGGYAIATADADLIQKDVISNILFSFFGVLVLFLYGFRRAAAIGYAGIPMALALALTFGLAALIFGTLSSASAGFAALLAGLGIDFTTVLYGRYVDERNRGSALPEALVTTFRTTLPSVSIAAATTAVTFFAFVLTDFRGMTQMGILTGIGILLFLLSVAFLLPALIVFNERAAGRREPTLYHHSFSSEKLVEASVRYPRRVILVWIVFLVVCGILATRIRFSDDIQNLRASGNRGVEVQAELTAKFGQSFNAMMFVTWGDSAEEALAASGAALPELDRLVASGTIGSYQSIASFVPPEERQRQAIEYIRSRPEAFDPERIEGRFRQELSAGGFRPQIYDEWLAGFRKALAPGAPRPIAELMGRDPSNLASRFLRQTTSGWMSVIYLYPADGAWPRTVPDGLSALAAKHPEAILTGVNLVSGTLRAIVRDDAFRATTVGTAMVFLLMFAGFRRVGVTLLSFIPFLAGVTGMVGLMALLGLEFNFMNVFVGLMTVGVGTDYAIYMLKRFVEDPEMFSDGAAAETAKSIAMAAVTTVVGYGSFAFSHYPGLRSIGYASTFGIALSALATITLLPAILRLRSRSEKTLP